MRRPLHCTALHITALHFTCFLLEGFCEELHYNVIEVPASDAPVAHCRQHPHVLLDEVYYGHTVALEKEGL